MRIERVLLNSKRPRRKPCSFIHLIKHITNSLFHCEYDINGASQPDGMCCLFCFSVFVKAALKISDNFCLLVSVFRGERGEVCSVDSKRFSCLRRECYKSVCF